jgi:hypothetical protein
MKHLTLINCRGFASAVALAAACVAPAASALAQAPAGTVEPILRVDHEEPTAQVASRVPPAAAPAAESPFDLTQAPGEHPLMPALRFAKESLTLIDQNIKDYQAIMYKQERIDGELMPQEVALVKVRHEPFSVHMFFLSPNRGRECLYVEGPNGTDGNLLAREGSGLKRRMGVVKLDPLGRFAMDGQKYPITKLGVRNLTTELIDVASKDVNFGECEVLVSQTTIGPKDGEKRPVTLIDVTHPTPRRNFRFHRAQIYIDNELRLPIRYAAFLWPAAAGEAPPLEEAYTYLNMKVNNGFTDQDFSAENPALFADE